jgi:hypothetical protein
MMCLCTGAERRVVNHFATYLNCSGRTAKIGEFLAVGLQAVQQEMFVPKGRKVLEHFATHVV